MYAHADGHAISLPQCRNNGFLRLIAEKQTLPSLKQICGIEPAVTSNLYLNSDLITGTCHIAKDMTQGAHIHATATRIFDDIEKKRPARMLRLKVDTR